MRSEAAEKADFSLIRYAQCWEDADILLPALNIREGGTIVSITSAGDNTFSILSRNAGKVYALDLSGAQLACLDFRRASYQCLNHPEFLALLGARPCPDRLALYRKIREALTPENRNFWDAQPGLVAAGIAHAGKFEHYFKLFSTRVLPLVHSKDRVLRLLEGGDAQKRRHYYDTVWNTWRWRLIFRLFFSRAAMGRLGRDPAFFQYVEGSVADRILERTAYALRELDPAENPYLHWILRGTFGNALPHALRAENFDAIRSNLHRLEFRQQSLEAFIDEMPPQSVDGYNLSDIFEYMSGEQTTLLYQRLLAAARPEARIVYWNMLAPRECPAAFNDRILKRTEEADRLFREDKAFFYSAFRVEEVRP